MDRYIISVSGRVAFRLPFSCLLNILIIIQVEVFSHLVYDISFLVVQTVSLGLLWLFLLLCDLHV